ncbi:MAG: 4-hydroxy-tetrahydrodipicolinate synthase [Candidatus Atribacteria bacterium]|nr:4-hydroxy-tetrahydrodipicolinate synthase [Candidatus Atribacteria bacterium]
MESDFGQMLTAVVTPFDSNFAVNYDQFRKLLTYLVNEGSDGIVVSGTTGEAPTLTKDEKLKLFEVALEEVGDRAKIIAGTCSYDTHQSMILSQEAEKIGVHGILAVAPYYNKPPQEGLYQHFKAIAEKVSIPIMLYNIPSRTGVNIEPETVARLSEIPNICALKEAAGSADQLSVLRNLLPKDFALYSGDDNMTLVVLTLGGKGVVSVASHVAGREIKNMIVLFKQGKIEEALRLHLRLYSLFKIIFISTNPIPIKAALNLLGWSVGDVRLPLSKMEKEKEEKLKNTLLQLGYLS